MAQWIPKTAWKVSSLNKRYGPQYSLKPNQAKNIFVGDECTLDARSTDTGESSRAKVVAQLANIVSGKPQPSTTQLNRGNVYKSVSFIDTRPSAERRLMPLDSNVAVALHPHDILSGAAVPILPWNKAETELFVVSSEAQRSANVCSALNRFGYTRVHTISYHSAMDLIKRAWASQKESLFTEAPSEQT